ncbi:hypothetical protein LTS18_005813 [Coniosporium uncinatum]|uniref:Uncharacterized protein n=2 Tax=Coniosporium uncinatum TaxID=93489 RepID=A0ACC3DRB0_9PEZI|nr:hypothetical protein LTS18_005372 [Coniosporium uncinatum]KAK3079070.1 hypothetical protein LTS18_005813 [Coniosporium uncinatum]
MPLDVVAIMHPAAGKADRLEELLSTNAKWVLENEPGVLKYHVQRQHKGIKKGEEPKLIMLETYQDQPAFQSHGSSPTFKAFGKKLQEEKLLAKPFDVFVTKAVGGFVSRL